MAKPPVVATEQPNIIFIMADDLGYADLGSYGQQLIHTPNLDQFAAEGIRFTNAYTGSPVCAPSRSVLMTGQHTGHTTVRGNIGKGGVRGLGGTDGRVPLRAEDVTIAEVLKEAGYTTGMAGKWGIGEPDTTGEPNAQGFDDWFGFLNQKRAHTHYPTYLWRNREKVWLKGNLEEPKTDYSHDMFTDFALDFIRTHHESPFFLYLPYIVPHARYEIPSVDPYADRPWADDEKVHAAMVTRLDRDVGRLIDLLKALKIDENTVVFFCSDNGADRRWEGRFDSSGPLRGKKRDMYEGGIRTPVLVRWPGTIRGGEVSALPWYFPDLLPTLAQLGGGEVPNQVDGVSILPTLLGQKQDLSERPMYWEFHERGFSQAVRWGKWKAVRFDQSEAIELYDLSTDIGEQNNLADAHPEVVKKIQNFLKEARSPSEHWPLEP